jgi:hypothetical protein
VQRGALVEKYIYLIRNAERQGRGRFNSAVLDDLVPRLLDLGPDRLKVSLTEVAPPRVTLLPLKRDALALISVWGVEHGLERWQASLASTGAQVAGYRVTESVPVACERYWCDGEASPGAVLLTLMTKNAALTREQFMAEWFGKHTPLALEVHPLWNYIRNVVDCALNDGCAAFDGIVEEHFRTLSDITNPARFFGGRVRMFRNMVRVGRHASRFLDLSATENYILTEYHICS